MSVTPKIRTFVKRTTIPARIPQSAGCSQTGHGLCQRYQLHFLCVSLAHTASQTAARHPAWVSKRGAPRRRHAATHAAQRCGRWISHSHRCRPLHQHKCLHSRVHLSRHLRPRLDQHHERGSSCLVEAAAALPCMLPSWSREGYTCSCAATAISRVCTQLSARPAMAVHVLVSQSGIIEPDLRHLLPGSGFDGPDTVRAREAAGGLRAHLAHALPPRTAADASAGSGAGAGAGSGAGDLSASCAALVRGEVFCYRDTDSCATSARYVWVVAIPAHLSPARLFGEFLPSVLSTRADTIGEQQHARGDSTPGADAGSCLRQMTHALLTQSEAGSPGSALLCFDCDDAASTFVASVSGRRYSRLHPATCYARTVQSVSTIPAPTSSLASAAKSSPTTVPCTLSPWAPSSVGVLDSAPIAVECWTRVNHHRLMPAVRGAATLTQLPTCPTCLERLDKDTTGLHTVGCSHLTACDCDLWLGTTCMCCALVAGAACSCELCGQRDNLWVCMVCGHVGCARYANEHAVAHFRRTGHNYCLDLGTRRIWDYNLDRYAHRIADRRPGFRQKNGAMQADGAARDKMESMSFEYSLLLASQLEAQNQLFGERLVRGARSS